MMHWWVGDMSKPRLWQGSTDGGRNWVRHIYIPNSDHCVPGKRRHSSIQLLVWLTHHRHPMLRFHPCTLSTVDLLIWVPLFHFRSHCCYKHHPEGCHMFWGCLWHCATLSQCPEDIPLADRLGRPWREICSCSLHGLSPKIINYAENFFSSLHNISRPCICARTSHQLLVSLCWELALRKKSWGKNEKVFLLLLKICLNMKH